MRSQRASRPPRPTRGFALLLLGSLLVAPGAGIRAEAGSSGPARRGFEPSLVIGAGLHAQSLSGSHDIDFAETTPGRQSQYRFSFSEAELALFSPTLTETLGLRLFLHGGGQLPFTRVHLAENGSNSFNTRSPRDREEFEANCAELPPNEPLVTPREPYPGFSNGFCAVESRNETIANGSVFAGLGIDITLPWWSRRVHLRPSVNWFAESLRNDATATRLTTGEGKPIRCDTRRDTYAGQRCNDERLNDAGRDTLDIYQANFTQSDVVRARTGSVWLHGLGPRLEVDVEVGKVGNMTFEIFAQTAIYWILSDRTREFSSLGGTGEGFCEQSGPKTILVNGVVQDGPDYCSPHRPGGEPLRASYRSSVGPTVVQGGMGLRVIWKGWSL